MPYILTFLYLLFFLSGNAQTTGDNAFIFDDAYTRKYTTSTDEIVSVMADYYEGVEFAKGEKLSSAFHDSWHMRDNDGTDNQFIHVEDKQQFITRVTNHGNYEGYASHRKIGAVEIIHDQLAYVRIDKAPTRSATLFFLGRIEGEWKIIDKLWVYQEEEFEPLPTNQLLSVISQFNDSNRDKGFDAKVLGNGSYAVSNKPQLIDHPTKLVSITGVYDRLAIVRSDYPALNTTVFSVLFRLNEGWKMACERVSKME